MPIHEDLLEILCDPVTKVPVEMLSASKLTLLNEQIAAGKITDSQGKTVDGKLEEALITKDGKTIYRIDGGIPIMLAEHGIPATQNPRA